MPLPYQRRLFHARRPDLLRLSRIPGTLAISTNASSHFILPTIPDRKPFYKNSRQQESKKTIAIGLRASRGEGREVFQGPGFVDRGSWTRKNRIKGPELLGQGKRRGTISRKDAMTSDLRPIQRYRNESNVIYTVFLGCHNVTVSTSIGRLRLCLSV